MEVWIVEDGEKRGPFQTYELRDRIERKELNGDELSWHKDQDEWLPLRELDVFRGEFEESAPELFIPPPLPSSPHPFLRFWAHWFDVFLYQLCVFALVRLTGQDLVQAMFSPWFRNLYMLPFLILEALCIHLYKTTPGKFFLGIRVVLPDERPLALGAALMRSIRVFIVGMGILFWILPFICHALCLWYTLKNNEAPWDTIAGNKVRVVGPLLVPVFIFMMLFAIVLVLLSLVLMPALFELRQMAEETAKSS